MMRKNVWMVVLMAALVLSACSTPTPASQAMPSATPEVMMATATPEMMMETNTPEAMMNTAMPGDMMETNTPDTMMATEMPGDMMGTATPDEMMVTQMPGDMMSTATPDMMMMDTPDAMMTSQTPVTMMGTPDWFSTSLTDVTSGMDFTISGFSGKVVVVETMATWCPSCLEQQTQIKAYLDAAGMNDQVKIISLDIDQNEDSALLKSYVADHNFDWEHAVAPAAVAREIGKLYGDQFLNPMSTPVLIVDTHGDTHLLPFGIKNADALKQAIDSYMMGM